MTDQQEHDEPQSGGWGTRLRKAGEVAGKAAKAGAEFATEKAREQAEKRKQEKQFYADAKSTREAELIAQARNAYVKVRLFDMREATKRNVVTGTPPLPFRPIDVVQGLALTGGKGDGSGVHPTEAFETVKDQLWDQCLYLGGNAVIECHFEWHEGKAQFQNRAATALNRFTGAIAQGTGGMATNLTETRTETRLSVFAYGTAVELFNPDQAPTVEDIFAWQPPDTSCWEPPEEFVKEFIRRKQDTSNVVY